MSFLLYEFYPFFRVDNIFYTGRSSIYFFDRSYYFMTNHHQVFPNTLIETDLRSKIYAEDSQTLDFLLTGKMMSSIFQDELAYQCYYIAHLRDHENIGANSQMPRN